MKKLCALLLVLALSLCLMPMTALADDPCANGHTLDLNAPRMEPNCQEGYHFEYYLCTKCYTSCHADGTVVNHDTEWEEALTGHTLNLDDPRIDADCQEGYHFEYYHCADCSVQCRADGTELDFWTDREEALTDIHTPDLENPQRDPDCIRGYHFKYYYCTGTGCSWECHADGTVVDHDTEWEEALTDIHTPLAYITDRYTSNGDFSACEWRLSSETYICECGELCDQNGIPTYTLSENQNPVHDWVLVKAGEQVINSCVGWCEEDYYMCSKCGKICGVATDGTADPENHPIIKYPAGNKKVVHTWFYLPGNNTFRECWRCPCGEMSMDAEGTRTVAGWHELLLKKDGENSNPGDTTEPDDTTKPVEYAIALLISINPQFTIYADAKGNVLSVDFMNEDALSLQSEIRTSDCTVKECIADIMAAAEANGFFGETPEMTVQIMEANVSEAELNAVLEGIQNMEAVEGESVAVKIINADGSEYVPSSQPDKDPDSPATGDINITLLFAILLCGVMGLLTVIYCRKKYIF